MIPTLLPDGKIRQILSFSFCLSLCHHHSLLPSLSLYFPGDNDTGNLLPLLLLLLLASFFCLGTSCNTPVIFLSVAVSSSIYCCHSPFHLPPILFLWVASLSKRWVEDMHTHTHTELTRPPESFRAAGSRMCMLACVCLYVSVAE